MALILKDRVKETTAVTSTGTATLLGAVAGYQSFSAIGSGNTCYYTIASQAGTEWEVGIGTYTSPDQLSRDTVLASSNSGSLVNFSAGTKDVFVTQPAEKAVYTNASNVINTSGNGANVVTFTQVNTTNLVANTEILKQDIQSILTQNLAKGISKRELLLELQELYPAYARNAYTIVNTGLSRTFIDTNISKFKESDFDWYIWAGPDDKITREQPCKHWVWHRFPASQLATITATRMRLWNCRHSIIPIPSSDIKKYPVGNVKYA